MEVEVVRALVVALQPDDDVLHDSPDGTAKSLNLVIKKPKMIR